MFDVRKIVRNKPKRPKTNFKHLFGTSMWPYLAEYKTKKLLAPCLTKVLVFKKTMKNIKRGQVGNFGKAIPQLSQHRTTKRCDLCLAQAWTCHFTWAFAYFLALLFLLEHFQARQCWHGILWCEGGDGTHVHTMSCQWGPFRACLGTVLGPCYGHFGLIGPLFWQLGLCCTHVRLMSGLNRQTILKQKCHPLNDIKININCNCFRPMHAHNFFFLASSVWADLGLWGSLGRLGPGALWSKLFLICFGAMIFWEQHLI